MDLQDDRNLHRRQLTDGQRVSDWSSVVGKGFVSFRTYFYHYMQQFSWRSESIFHWLSEGYLEALTFIPGDIYSFNPNDWEVYDKEMQDNISSRVQYRVVDINDATLCNKLSKYTYFPDKYNFRDGTKLCKKFGGRRADVSTREDVEDLVDFLISIKEDPLYLTEGFMRTVSMFTDEETTNVWSHHETGLLPQDAFKWFYAEPNGGKVENCAELWVKEDASNGGYVSGFNDNSCSEPLPVACQDLQASRFLLRGV